MHGSKRFVLVQRDYWNVADEEDYSFSPLPLWRSTRRRFRHVPARWKRSRHRTRADRYGLTEAHLDCCGPNPRGNAPAWFRKHRNRRYRARTQQLMRVERYDELVAPQRDAAWNYW
jgi:hypothetical protein